MIRYTVEYSNETDADDDFFWEWWSVIDTENKEEICKCNKETNAIDLCRVLNTVGMWP